MTIEQLKPVDDLTNIDQPKDTDPLNEQGSRMQTATPQLSVDHLSRTYGTGANEVRALADISFQVEQGEFVSIVGPSGCGKTTLLKCMSGLLTPSSGTVTFQGAAVTDVPRGLGVVFQEYTRSLLPWYTVEENIALPLKAQRLSKADRSDRVQSALQAVGLDGFGAKYPWQLSGGMQQRVAIARALAFRPSLLLMDEPFASVDAQTRAELEDLVLKIHFEFKMTTVFVTHDIDESVYLGDKVVVLSNRPTVVKELIDIELARPRDQIATKETTEYASLRSRVIRSIRNQEEK